MILLNTLLLSLRSVILIQLLQSDKSPFLASPMISLVFHSSVLSLEIHISLKIFRRMAGVRHSSAFSSSAQMLCAPGALSFLISSMAFLISWYEGGAILSGVRSCHLFWQCLSRDTLTFSSFTGMFPLLYPP